MNILIIPVHNEALTIERTYAELIIFCNEYFKNDYGIVFVDDWSSDETYLILSEKICDKVYVSRNLNEGGKGSALKYGYEFAIERGADSSDYFIFLDGDGQINPKEIKAFFNIMKTFDADVVIGNKRHKYSHIKYNLKRHVLSIGYNFIVRKLFGFRYEDTQCGIKIFKKDALAVVMDKVTIIKYAFDIELMVALIESDLKIADAPVLLRGQKNAGAGKISNAIRMFIDTAHVWKRKKRGYYTNA